MKYFLMTATKNEEKNISHLVRSVEKQTIKPIVWIIVDESTDNTRQIIKEIAKKYKWVKNIFLKNGEGYLGINYGIACKTGFDFAIGYCKQHKMEYDYIGLIDADVNVDGDFFERLMIEFEKDSELGIASGSEYWNISGKLVRAGLREELPIGPARLWRRKCFNEAGGYLATASPDSVSNVKAKLRGWKTKQFKDIKVITRRTSTARGHWWGSLHDGKNYYSLNYHPFIFLLRTIRYTFKKPYYTGFGLFIGYFGALIQGKKKMEDDEIKYYYRHTRPKEIFRYYFDMLRDKLKGPVT